MTLDGLLAPWSQVAYRHIPAGSPYGVMDFRFTGAGRDSRWNYPGQPTLYLASDDGVAVTEFGRHLDENRAPGLRSAVKTRELYRLTPRISRVLNLRDQNVLRMLALANAPYCFLDKDVARATANYLRTVTRAQAILVPSRGFLDQPHRWVSVLFLEKLPTDPDEFIVSVELAGTFSISR